MSNFSIADIIKNKDFITNKFNIMKTQSFNDSILNYARSYIGKEEISGNKGFKDVDFQKKIEACGWDKGQAWCSYFCELVWKQAYGQYNTLMVVKLDKLFSANAYVNYDNFKKAGFKVSEKAEAGSLAIWSKYKNGKKVKVDIWTIGHIGIVEKIFDDYFVTIEGNTSKEGSREGLVVGRNNRKYSFNTNNGLRLKGFIHPVAPDEVAAVAKG